MSVPAMTRMLALLASMLVICVGARAETIFVGDRFEIGVHESKSIDSVILAVIASGTPLDVITRDGDFVEVTTPEGIKGWVDARYVVTEKPGLALLAERDARIQEVNRSLGDARAEVEVLRQRVTELQRDAATAARGNAAAAQTVALAPGEDAKKLEEAEQKLADLTRENRLLQVQVSDLQATNSELAESVADAGTGDAGAATMWEGPISQESRAWTPWQWLLFGSILLLAFAAGGYAVDWDFRRRHGGFRV